jgi:hypothetical protein
MKEVKILIPHLVAILDNDWPLSLLVLHWCSYQIQDKYMY